MKCPSGSLSLLYSVNYSPHIFLFDKDKHAAPSRCEILSTMK